MKFHTLISMTAVCLLALGCANRGADRADHAAHHPATAKIAATSDKGMSMMKEDMQQHMQKMQDTMAKIHQAKSPQERQKLMDQHMAQMQEGMGMMKDMQGEHHGMMMSDGEKKMCADKKKDSMMGEGKKMCADKMEDGKMKGGMCGMCGMKMRMDTMEQMMGQMLEHQAAQQK